MRFGDLCAQHQAEAQQAKPSDYCPDCEGPCRFIEPPLAIDLGFQSFRAAG